MSFAKSVGGGFVENAPAFWRAEGFLFRLIFHGRATIFLVLPKKPRVRFVKDGRAKTNNENRRSYPAVAACV